jgi:hypothetical protein
MFKSGANLEENVYTNATWKVNQGQFASNMTAITKIYSDCEYLNDKQDLTIGVFDNVGVARGVSPIEMQGVAGLSYLTIGGDINEGFRLSLLDNNTSESYTLNQDIDYIPNAHLGSITNPFEINISDEVCFKMQADAGVLTDYFKVYPTLIENSLNLDYIGHTQDLDSKARLYNVWGQRVWESAVNVEQGFNRIKLDLSRLDLAPGVYHFILDSNGETQTVKLMSE